MKLRKLAPVALALASLACAVTLNKAKAGIEAGLADATARAEAQLPVRLAQTTVATPKPVKKTKSLKVEHPKTKWLNPQPEPPMAGKKPVQGNNWLNPQPEPPRPDTAKKLH